MKPPVPYFGRKMRVAPTIVDLLPEHGHYVEPFFGSGAVLFAKPQTAHETVNDLDGVLVTFWRVLRDRPDELIRACALTPHARAEYNASQALDAADELELARQVFVKLTQGRSGRLLRTGWRHYINPARSTAGMPAYLRGYVDRIAIAAQRLQNVALENRPALDVIARYGADPQVLLYVDPPYLGTTRSNDRAYRVEMRDETQHRELADALHACRAAVVVSGYPSQLYDNELYASWDRHTITTYTGQGGAGWDPRTEVLWSNRPLCTQTRIDIGGAA